MISKNQKKLFKSLFDREYKYNLLMRGSWDGFKGNTFLNKCSNKEKTVIIVKDTNSKIFGGYTD